MLVSLVESLSYPFVMRALLVGLFVAVTAGLLGVILVLNRYSLIGHGLSDVGFASLTIGLVMGLTPLVFAGPAVVVAALIMMVVSQRYGASGDVAIGVASTGALPWPSGLSWRRRGRASTWTSTTTCSGASCR